MRKVLGSILATIGLAAGFLLTSGTEAMAANPYSPSEACSSQGPDGTWTQLERHVLTNNVGATYLMYKNGYNCVTTIKWKDIGVSSPYVEAALAIEDSRWRSDEGEFKYYAATAQYAAGKCVRGIEGWITTRNYTKGGYENYDWKYCG